MRRLLQDCNLRFEILLQTITQSRARDGLDRRRVPRAVHPLEHHRERAMPNAPRKCVTRYNFAAHQTEQRAEGRGAFRITILNSF